MTATASKLLRRKQLRNGSTPFERLPWDLQRFAIDFLRAHLCEITVPNCQVVACALERCVRQKGPLCPAQLWIMLEHDVFFD
jgi:hypothetical protein